MRRHIGALLAAVGLLALAAPAVASTPPDLPVITPENAVAWARPGEAYSLPIECTWPARVKPSALYLVPAENAIGGGLAFGTETARSDDTSPFLPDVRLVHAGAGCRYRLLGRVSRNQAPGEYLLGVAADVISGTLRGRAGPVVSRVQLAVRVVTPIQVRIAGAVPRPPVVILAPEQVPTAEGVAAIVRVRNPARVPQSAPEVNLVLHNPAGSVMLRAVVRFRGPILPTSVASNAPVLLPAFQSPGAYRLVASSTAGDAVATYTVRQAEMSRTPNPVITYFKRSRRALQPPRLRWLLLLLVLMLVALGLLARLRSRRTHSTGA